MRLVTPTNSTEFPTMRKLATLALLALSLLTVACTEQEDTDPGLEAASIDEPLYELGQNPDSVAQRAPSVKAPGAESIGDRIGGVASREDATSNEPTTDTVQQTIGVADCFIPVTEAANGEPITDSVADAATLGQRARF